MDLVKKRKDWLLVDIYADEAITGTQVTKRENFQRMINDCMDGKIDMIITKSISRFARNTEETIDKATYEKKYSELESILEG